MTDSTHSEPNANADDSRAEPAQVAGVLAQFADAGALLEAARQVRAAGYRRWDCHTPFPVHGMERAMGIRMTVLPWLVALGGATGVVVALGMQWWMNAVDYPLIISGKPLFSLPANIPVAFELLVLFGALAAFFGVLALNGLPRLAHPLLANERFRRATTDGFFLSIEAADPNFDSQQAAALLDEVGAASVETFKQVDAGRAIPRGIVLALAVVVLAAMIPPLVVAQRRAGTSEVLRAHPVPDMDQQPRFDTQAATPLFDDRRTVRPPVVGTVARGELLDDAHLTLGLVDGQPAATLPQAVLDSLDQDAKQGDQLRLIRRGQQRYNIYCAPCHGLDGGGQGPVSVRAAEVVMAPGKGAWTQVPPLHGDEQLRLSLGQLYDTITSGVRREGVDKPTMPAYGPQISVEDRWAIVLYVRALQRSQRASPDDVPQQFRSQLDQVSP